MRKALVAVVMGMALAFVPAAATAQAKPDAKVDCKAVEAKAAECKKAGSTDAACKKATADMAQCKPAKKEKKGGC